MFSLKRKNSNIKNINFLTMLIKKISNKINNFKIIYKKSFNNYINFLFMNLFNIYTCIIFLYLVSSF